MSKGSVGDWAAKAARKIRGELSPRGMRPSEARIAAIIALSAEPIIKLLQEAQNGQHYDGVGDMPGPECAGLEDEDAGCTCGADEWNARVDAALRGEK